MAHASSADLLGLPTSAAPSRRLWCKQEVSGDFDVISRMSPLKAQHCLTVGSVQHRLNPLWRMILGDEISIFGDLMLKYDEALLGIPRRMTGRALLPDHAARLTGLPLASGGLGYRL